MASNLGVPRLLTLTAMLVRGQKNYFALTAMILTILGDDTAVITRIRTFSAMLVCCGVPRLGTLAVMLVTDWEIDNSSGLLCST